MKSILGRTTFTAVVLDSKASLPHPAVAMQGWPALLIAMPCCGEVRAWPRIEDVPENNVGPCRCGNWFIRYQGQPIPL